MFCQDLVPVILLAQDGFITTCDVTNIRVDRSSRQRLLLSVLQMVANCQVSKTNQNRSSFKHLLLSKQELHDFICYQ